MKMRVILSLVIVAAIFVISGCGGEDRQLKKDAKNIADVMCKSLEAMKNLKTADPEDSLLVQKLQLEYKSIETEMTTIYEEFRKKYGDKVSSEEFNTKFRKYLSESMLDCKSLSKEDRESFEKGMK